MSPIAQRTVGHVPDAVDVGGSYCARIGTVACLGSRKVFGRGGSFVGIRGRGWSRLVEVAGANGGFGVEKRAVYSMCLCNDGAVVGVVNVGRCGTSPCEEADDAGSGTWWH
jgi:hypothetical protein